uniref:SAM domain-containing protein n=1 Tax=Neogobius melanostomus TaxID=47308 RepID=A0A8C6WSX8_9GOBI
SKRYTVDPSDSAFSVVGTQYYQKRTFGFRSNSCPTPMPVCRQASSPRCFPEGHRNGEYKDVNKIQNSLYSQLQCGRLMTQFPFVIKVSVLFQEIDGDALLLLKSEMMMKYLGLKLGPALKLCYHIDKLRQSRS